MERINPNNPELNNQNPLVEILKQHAPEAFADGKINLETLSQLLGNHVEDEDQQKEHFGLNWTGKAMARKIAMKKPEGSTLVPAPGEGIDEDTTQNIFIEGDNLEVLKLLKNAYADQIKMIYIDPPYNTGNDFIYKDDFAEPIESYLKRTGQQEGEKLLVSNPKSEGRFHSNWLNHLYPRLKLAKDLLKPEGVIFISIDDNEFHNLRCIMNEIYGEENFLGNLIWNLRSGSQAGHLTRSHEYILCYARDKSRLTYFKDKSGGSIAHGALKRISAVNPASEITFPEGIQFDGIDAVFEGEIGGSEKQIILSDKMIFKNGKLVQPVVLKAGWAMKNQVLSWLSGKETFDSKGQKVSRFYFNNSGILWYEKERGTVHPKTVLPDEVGNTKTGSDELIDLFGLKLFDFPKPTSLISYLIDIVIDSSSEIILDFYAGSGTTSHAANKKNVKYISIQLPVLVNKDDETGKNAFTLGLKTISDISKERIRRASNKLKREGLSGDLGFKVYKLSSSNYKPWKDYTGTNVSQVKLNFAQITQSALIDNWQPNNIITEIMLQEGFPLHSTITTLPTFSENKVQEISSDFTTHRLLVCLDSKISSQTADQLQKSEYQSDIFICLDTALSDVVKLGLKDTIKLKVI